MTDQTPNPETVGPVLPGRAVDIVHAAVLAAGLTPFTIKVCFDLDGAPESVDVHAVGDVSPETAGALFAAVGVVETTTGPRYGGADRPLADVTGFVPVLGLQMRVMTQVPHLEVGDVRSLVAEVDAARAAQELETTR